LRGALHAATHQTLIGLMAVTGMRLGEAIGLDRDDVAGGRPPKLNPDQIALAQQLYDAGERTVQQSV
jgi:integrase